MASSSSPASSSRPAPGAVSERLGAMKFMKRKEEAKLRAKLEREEKAQLNEMQWIVPAHMLPATLTTSGAASTLSGIVPEAECPWYDDVDTVQALIHGRRSFGKFNPLLEAAQRTLHTSKQQAAARREEINDEEMTDRLSTYVGLVGGGRPQKKQRKKPTEKRVRSKSASASSSSQQQQQQQQGPPSKKFKRPQQLI